MSGRGRPNPRGGRGGPPRGGPSRGGPPRGGPSRGGPSRGGPPRGGPPRGGQRGGGRGRPTENPSHDTRSQAQVEQITQQVSHMALNRSNNAEDGTSLYMPQAIQAPTAQHVADGNKIDTRAQNQQALSKLKRAFDEDFPFRKAFAEAKTTVFSNHFAIEIDPSATFYEYDIHGIPSKMAKAKAKSLVQAMIDTDPFLKEHQHEFATDYLTRVISWTKLPPMKPISISLDDRGDPMQLELQLLGTVDIQLLRSHTAANMAPKKPLVEDTCNNDGKKRAGGELGPVINAVNILISTAISDGSVPFKGNKFFVMGGHKTLGSPTGSLCTIRGYFYTIKAGTGQTLLNLNACTSAFFCPILVSDFLNDQFTFPIEQDREDALQGLRVFVEYERGGKNDNAQSRTKVISATGEPVSQQTFQRRGKDGAPATFPSVEAYLKDAYNLVLKHPSLPAINVGTYHNPTWFAPEHLRIVPYQIYKRPVPDHLTSSMLDEACRKPENSRALIEHEGLKQLGIKAGGGLTRLSKCPAIQIDPRMIQIPSGRLQYPKIQYRSGPVSLFQPAWNLKDTKFLQSRSNAQFRVYALLDGRLLGGPNTVQRYLTAFHEFAQKTYATGIYQFCGSEIFQNPSAIPQAMKNAQEKGANFTLLILKQKSAISYSTFKDLADRTYGMHSLCITEKPNYRRGGLNSNLAGYFGNVMMKVNLKAGGINHTVDRIADIMKDTLVLGADVTHPGPSALLGTPSIAAIVGSVDKTGGKFLGSMRLQPKETVEMIKDVESMVLERITDWSKCNGGALPKSIIYYRDGVSEGQFVQVKTLELPQIGKAYAKAAAKRKLNMAKFKLTAITVMKRHHVRFYPLHQDAAPTNRNCQPGTLVDSVVTSPFYQDFYLQSHNGLKGTAKPAHYFVLVNEMGLSENAMQSFTHNLCYTYVRATLGVSYAPPAYYADRLCERGRCYLRQFFVAGPDIRKDLDNLKVRLQLEKKEKREKQFKPLRTQVGQGYWQKSDGEKYQEDEDKKEIEALLKLDTLEKAKKAFYPGGVVGNPWKERIAGTMFWM